MLRNSIADIFCHVWLILKKNLILTEIYFYIVLDTHQWLDEDGDQNIVSVASHSAEVQGCCLWRYPW